VGLSLLYGAWRAPAVIWSGGPPAPCGRPLRRCQRTPCGPRRPCSRARSGRRRWRRAARGWEAGRGAPWTADHRRLLRLRQRLQSGGGRPRSGRRVMGGAVRWTAGRAGRGRRCRIRRGGWTAGWRWSRGAPGGLPLRRPPRGPSSAVRPAAARASASRRPAAGTRHLAVSGLALPTARSVRDDRPFPDIRLDVLTITCSHATMGRRPGCVMWRTGSATKSERV
jgi:hypothetical protein